MEVEMSKVSTWLSELSSIREYRSRGKILTVRVQCHECGRTLSPNELIRALSISGLNQNQEEEGQHVFHDICPECYSILKNQIEGLMR